MTKKLRSIVKRLEPEPILDNKLSVQRKVTEILKTSVRARNSDRVLYSEYLSTYHPSVADLTILDFLNISDIPSYDMVSRCRRKAQQKDETLKANKKVENNRRSKEAEFIDYAINN